MPKKYKLTILMVLLCLFYLATTICHAKHFSKNSSYNICFTPNDNCANQIINEIKNAKKQILVQAYIFTDKNIANELVSAKINDVDVKIILDKKSSENWPKITNLLINNKINVILVNCLPAIAHNKIFIIDGITTITGSYNYTKGARKNEENIAIIKDRAFAEEYIKNWRRCSKQCLFY